MAKEDSDRGDLVEAFDAFVAGQLDRLGQTSSRRGFLARVGKATLGALGFSVVAAAPILHLSQAAKAANCNNPDLCGLWGRTCDCCNGGQGLYHCPGSATAASNWWSRCCRDTGDNTRNLIRYVDCCGGSANCGSCTWCENNPIQQPAWCSGYKCTKIVWVSSC